MVLRAASLFAGVGGLDLGLKLACPGTRCVVYVERDAYAAATLVARMEDEAMDQAPVCADVTTFDGRPWRGKVDILVGGFPCQDISVAGKGEGIGGKRSGLWSEIVRLADEIRPRYLFLENVSAIITRGLSTVLADLAALGFDAEWCCLRASDVGAPHRRERWFCLAHRNLDGSGDQRLGTDEDMGDTIGGDSDRRPTAGLEGQAGPEARCCEVDHTSGVMGDGRRPLDDTELVGDRGIEAKPLRTGRASADVAMRPFPPGPADHDAWRRVLEEHPELAPAVESDVRRVVDGMAERVDESRADQLRCCGNGVVPLQTAVAFRELMRRIGE